MSQTPQDVQQRLGILLGQAAGYVGFRTVEIGLRYAIFDRLRTHPDPLRSSRAPARQ